MVVIGVLVVGGCYRRTRCATIAVCPYKCRHVARCLLSVLRLLSTDQFHPFRLAYSGGINKHAEDVSPADIDRPLLCGLFRLCRYSTHRLTFIPKN